MDRMHHGAALEGGRNNVNLRQRRELLSVLLRHAPGAELSPSSAAGFVADAQSIMDVMDEFQIASAMEEWELVCEQNAWGAPAWNSSRDEGEEARHAS